MNKKEFVRRNIGLIFYFVILAILIFFMMKPDVLANAFYPEYDNNPFDDMRECEEQHNLSGIITHVEYVDWKHCKLIMNQYSYNFKGWDYADLKSYEGQQVNITCFTNCWDGLYYLDALNYEWRGGVFPVLIV